MRTFIIRARKGSTRFEKLREDIGGEAHVEVIAHSVMNAFFVSNGFREDVEVYIVLDSSDDFPRTIHLDGSKGVSIKGFHEEAVFKMIENALKNGQGLQKNETREVEKGVSISAFGFEKLVGSLTTTRQLYLLDNKGENIRETEIAQNPVFILSDHLALPKNNVKSLKRQGLQTISLGKKMLFASQCVVLLHYEMDHIDL